MSEFSETSPDELKAEDGAESFARPEETSPVPEKKKLRILWIALAFALILTAGIAAGLIWHLRVEPSPEEDGDKEVMNARESDLPLWIDEAFLTLDGESRTGQPLEEVVNIAVHYVANPGSSAIANRNYFEGPDSDTSSHFIVGLQGEILAVIPLDEKSCATNERNRDTISVEVCHPDATGEFSLETYESLIRLLAYLCDRFDLTGEDLIRHYDVTGKMCPRFYVENPDAWEQMKMDVDLALKEGDFRD